MIDVAVARLTLRCRAPASHEQWAIRTRRRLDGIARSHLPAALETALGAPGAVAAGTWRLYVDELSVLLDFRPDDYDDVAVATLWAGGVRRALEACTPGAPGVHHFDDEPSYLRRAIEEYLASSRLSWVFDDLRCGTGWVLPLDFLGAFDSLPRRRTLATVLARTDLSRRLWDRLMPDERRAVAAAFGGRVRWGRWPVPDTASAIAATTATAATAASAAPPAPPSPTEAEPAGAAGAAGAAASAAIEPAPAPVDGAAAPARGELTFADWQEAIAAAAAGRSLPPGTASPARPGEGPTAVEAAEPGAAHGVERAGLPEPGPGDRAAAPRDSSPPPEVAGHPAWTSAAGGLVLLYPWLTEHLREVEAAAPEPPGEARRRALAALAAPGEAWTLADPLVIVLTGSDPDAAPPLAPGDPEPDDDRARPVLRAFAAVLPGFEDSTAGFIRSELLLRPALVVPTATDQVRVILGHRPLDMLLDHLPYPLGPFRLPPGPLVLVEQEPDDAR